MINTFSIYVKLYLKIVLRFLLILFRKDRCLKEFHFDCGNENVFQDSLLIINYRFKNAIYFKINNKITLEKKVKIFNIKNIDSEIHFIVYGWFEKKHYVIKVKPDKSLNNESFRTQLSNLNISFIVKSIPQLIKKQISITKNTTTLKTSRVSIANKKTQFKTYSFNQNDYL